MKLFSRRKNKPTGTIVGVKSISDINLRQSKVLIKTEMKGCPHCKNFAPVFEKVCGELKDTQCYNLRGDTKEGQQALTDLGMHVQGFPTTIVCKENKQGVKVCTPSIQGAYPEKMLRDALENQGFEFK